MIKYDEFVERVNDAGFLTPFTNYIDPEIFTWGRKNSQAYSGNLETDPEQWKTRSARERKLAYGCFFNGRAGGYISPRFYSIFIDAFNPRITPEERYESGKLGKYEKIVWDLLNQHGTPLSWSDFRQKAGLSPANKYKQEINQLDSALKQLQVTFDVTICGTTGNMGVIKSIIGFRINGWT